MKLNNILTCICIIILYVLCHDTSNFINAVEWTCPVVASPSSAPTQGNTSSSTHESSGTFDLMHDCTMSNEVTLTGSLTITGRSANNLTVLTAASTSRHFSVTNDDYTLTLKYIKLTGGHVEEDSSGTSSGTSSGGGSSGNSTGNSTNPTSNSGGGNRRRRLLCLFLF